MLRPASGFQSWQFKELEAKLGLKFEHRHGKEYYTSQLRKEHVEQIKNAERNKSLLELLNAWLERMPFFNEKENWAGIFKASLPGKGDTIHSGMNIVIGTSKVWMKQKKIIWQPLMKFF